MGVTELMHKVADKVGLGEEEIEELLADGSSPEVDFDQQLPGEASDVLEIFLADSGEGIEDANGWLWYPMIRSGQFATRPGPKGQKVRKPLKIVAGNSSEAEEIGLADLKDAFDDDAVDYVTVPTSHDNKVLDNTGFVRGMKIMDSKIATGPDKGKKVPTLFGGYDFTEPDVKAKVKRGTIPGRSCGILYEYVNTETGTEYKSVVEHVALTPKPWIRGMVPFGRRLSEGKDPVSLSLSDEPPTEPEEVGALLQDGGETVTWTHEDSPNWLRQQVNQILDEARAAKRKARGSNNASYIEDPIPYYRANEAKHEGDGGKALICDGYGDGANWWVAGFSIADGSVSLDAFSKWSPVKSVYVADERPAPPTTKQPLAESTLTVMMDAEACSTAKPWAVKQGDKVISCHKTKPEAKFAIVRKGKYAERTARGDLILAQTARKASVKQFSSAASQAEVSDAPLRLAEQPNVKSTHPRGGEQMSDTNGTVEHDLSEEARTAIEAAEQRAAEAESKAEKLEEKVGRLSESRQEQRVEGLVAEVQEMGLDEEHGFSGALVELRNILLADDGEPAVVSENFSEDDKEEALSLTECFERFFSAIKKGEDGKLSLGEQLEQPSNEGGEGEEGGESGKPAKDEVEQELSASEKADKVLSENPELAGQIGVPVPAAKVEEEAK